jgi:hypothetical protein
MIRDFIEGEMTIDNWCLPPPAGFREAMVLTAVLTDAVRRAFTHAFTLSQG